MIWLKIKNNWRKIVAIPFTMIVFIAVSLGLLYISNIVSGDLGDKINFYWWEQMFRNKHLSYAEVMVHNNLFIIVYSFNYLIFLTLLLWSIFEKDKTLLSLIFFIFISGVGMTFNDLLIFSKVVTDFQIITSIIQKYSLLFMFGIFIFQVFSKFYKRKNIKN